MTDVSGKRTDVEGTIRFNAGNPNLAYYDGTGTTRELTNLKESKVDHSNLKYNRSASVKHVVPLPKKEVQRMLVFYCMF